MAKPNLSRLEHDKVAPGLETLRCIAATWIQPSNIS